MRGDRALRALWVVAGVCALVAALLHVLPSSDARPSPLPPQSTADPHPIRIADTDTAPTRLRIPAIRVSAPVLPLALDATGALQVPGFRNAGKVGWYALGPRPGLPGPAVLVGHRDAPDNVYLHGRRVGDTHLTNGAFAKIGRLHPGDLVEVETGGGRRLAFGVTRVDTYPTDRFPTARVYAPVARPELRLITCGGVIAPNGHWDANVVVSAVAESPAAASRPVVPRVRPPR